MFPNNRLGTPFSGLQNPPYFSSLVHGPLKYLQLVQQQPSIELNTYV